MHDVVFLVDGRSVRERSIGTLRGCVVEESHVGFLFGATAFADTQKQFRSRLLWGLAHLFFFAVLLLCLSAGWT